MAGGSGSNFCRASKRNAFKKKITLCFKRELCGRERIYALGELKQMNKGKIEKICFAASSGGHYEQLLMLKPLMERYKSFVITEETLYKSEVQGIRTYYLKQVNRKEKTYIRYMIINIIRSLNIFFKEKPDMVICTGVLAMIPICLIAKAFGKKLIYIESFAKVTSATLSGSLLYKFADQFYVQWPQMLEIYPKAIYLGGIY